MPAGFVPHEVIPALAARITPDMLEVLHHIQKAGAIENGADLDRETATAVRQLAEWGLIDPAYQGNNSAAPYLWFSNWNGSRVLSYLTGIRSDPHYEIHAAELAAWLEEQGKERYWNVDGDPLLGGRRPFPCPAGDLAEELRKIGRPLLVQAKKEDAGARGQCIGKEKLNDLVAHFADNLRTSGEGPLPRWSQDRLLYLCWKATAFDWLLIEDSETTEQYQADEAANAR